MKKYLALVLILSSAPAYSISDCQFLSLMKGLAVLQEDTSFQNCLMVLDRPNVFTEERRKYFCDLNKEKGEFTKLVSQLMEQSGC